MFTEMRISGQIVLTTTSWIKVLKLHLHDHEFDTNLGKIVIYKIRARIDKKYKFSCADKILSRVPSIRHEVIPT